MTFGSFSVDYEQRTYNPERMRKYRIDRAQAMLEKHGLGSMIVYDFDNFRYLGYYTWHNYMRRRPSRYLLLIKGNGYPYSPAFPPDSGEYQLMPWLRDKMILKYTTPIQWGLSFDQQFTDEQWTAQAAQIKDLLSQHGVANEPCGIDTHFGLHTVDYLRKAGIKLVDGNPAMAEARMIKNEDEIECCRTAGVITESAHWEVCNALRPGMTEWQVAGVASKALFDLGAEELEGPSFILSSGPRFGAYGVQTGTDRVIRPGEMFVIDINGVSFQGYRTCFYRTYCVGDKPTQQQKDIYNACYEIQMAMQESIKPGITNHDYARAVLEKGAGKWVGNLTFQGKKWGPTWPEPGRYYMSGGHQLGLASGDPGPGIGIRSSTLDFPPFTFQKNMVLAVEVGVREWDGSKWLYDGVKLENTGVITENGWEPFYRFPMKDLITCGLPGVY
ncbi:MAG: aminopeptidase P family protein [Chloroflexi bacterium]|nr:aminopeptidase P family protein [Chloroflexota bacterium]